MIQLLDLSTEESLDDQGPAKTPKRSSNSAFPPPLPSPVGSNESSQYNAMNIKKFLVEQPDKYVLVDNRKANTLKPSQCWTRFALPAVKDENNRLTIIQKFATCRSCCATYAYTYGSTKSLNAHKCPKESSSTSSSPSRSTFQIKSSSVTLKSNRSYVENKKTMTCLISKWICQSMRPISIVEDQGFLDVVKQCFLWSDHHFSGQTNDILPSRTAIQREISRQASEIRQNLSVDLIRAAEKGSLAISPDLWTDRFRQTSYLGISGHFTDDNYVVHSIDLCCTPYNEVNKRADSVLKAIVVVLSQFGLNSYMDRIVFVCDRGSNLVKALEDYKVIHCFPHRMNNVLKRTFYSTGTKEKNVGRRKTTLEKKIDATDVADQLDQADRDDGTLLDDDDRDYTSSETDDEVLLDTRSVELALRSLPSSSGEFDHINVPEEKLPTQASQLLTTITRCKQLCSYVKRACWNPLLSELGKPTIKQEIIVR